MIMSSGAWDTEGGTYKYWMCGLPEADESPIGVNVFFERRALNHRCTDNTRRMLGNPFQSAWNPNQQVKADAIQTQQTVD